MPCAAGRKRGVTDLLAEGARPCSCGRGPSLCMGTGCAVLLRNSPARGMIDLVSAGGGLSQCQASAQMGALKGESPFPLLKAEQQSPCHHPSSAPASWALSALQLQAVPSPRERTRGSREHRDVWGPSPTTLGSVAVFALEEGQGGMQGWLAEEMVCPSPLCLAATCPSSGCGSSSWKQRTFWGGKQSRL